MCNTFSQHYTTFHIAFYLFMRKHLAQRYNPAVLMEKFHAESQQDLEWSPKILKHLFELYPIFLSL